MLSFSSVGWRSIKWTIKCEVFIEEEKNEREVYFKYLFTIGSLKNLAYLVAKLPCLLSCRLKQQEQQKQK
jgi:hypothetical protein